MFRKSSYSNSQGACIETESSSNIVAVRDTMDRMGFTLQVGAEAWRQFTAALKAG